MHSIIVAGALILAHGSSAHSAGVLGDLLHTVLRAAAASIGWFLGRSIAHMLGFGVVALLVLAAVIWWVLRGRRAAPRRGPQR